MASNTIKLKTDTEHLLYKHLVEEQTERRKLETLVKDLKSHIEGLQRQLESYQEKLAATPTKDSQTETEKASEPVRYETDEEELAKETEWIRQQSRKKRKLNQSLTPPQKQAGPREECANKPKKAPQPPPIIVESVLNYQEFFDLLASNAPRDSFLMKMKFGDSVKISTNSEESYRGITKLLLENNNHWYSYENKQDRPIRVMAKNLHSSCIPGRIVEDLKCKGLNILEASNKQSWRNKKPLYMFILAFDKEEDTKKIYNIKSILGCKVDIQPLKAAKLIPQCKRCQAYGHTQKYCAKEPRCVKCTGKHLTQDCKKPAEAKPKCVHCGESHPANYRGCVVAKELQNIKNKAVQKANPSVKRISPDVKTNINKPVSKALSFAQVTNGAHVQSLLPSQPQQLKSPTSTLDDKVNQILNAIISFDQRIKRLEQSTKVASSKQK